MTIEKDSAMVEASKERIYSCEDSLYTDIGVPVDDTDFIHDVDRADTVRYRNSDGLLHREDGPAIEYPYGTREWWLGGEQLSEAEFEVRTS